MKPVTCRTCKEDDSDNGVLLPHRWTRITDICMVFDHCVPSNSMWESCDGEMLCQDPNNNKYHRKQRANKAVINRKQHISSCFLLFQHLWRILAVANY